MQLALLEMGFLNGFECIRNIVLRAPFRLIPRQLRTVAYQALLRDNVRAQPGWMSSPAPNLSGMQRRS